MKTSAVFRIIIYSVLIAVLCGVLYAGVTGDSFSFGFGSGVSYANAQLYTAGNGSVDYEGINTIEVNWIDGDINFVQSKTRDITFTETENDDPMQYLVSDGKLTIQFSKPYRFMAKTSKKDLTIAIPSAMEFRRLELANVNGDITGTTAFTRCDELSVDMVNGDMELDGYFEEIDCDMVNGEAVFNLGDTPREGNFDSVNGDFVLNVFHVEEDLEAEGFTAELDSISGKISSDFEVSIQGDKLVYGDGANELEFDTVSGDVQINKMKLE